MSILVAMSVTTPLWLAHFKVDEKDRGILSTCLYIPLSPCLKTIISSSTHSYQVSIPDHAFTSNVNNHSLGAYASIFYMVMDQV
jgi:hypothetical protein